MSGNENLPVLGTREVFKDLRDKVFCKIEFVDTIPNLDDVQNKWDVSDAQDGSIMAWVDDDIVLKISGNGTVLANEDCGSLFYGFENVVKFSFNGLLDTSNIKKAFGMFEVCQRLKYLDVANWNTKNLENAMFMFAECESLENLDLSKWDTKNLENACGMFSESSGLKKVELSNWNTKNLENAEGMFEKCYELETIDVANWNTQNLKNAKDLFHGCNSLKEIDLSDWNTDNLQEVSNIFYWCEELEKVITSCDKIIDEIDDKSIIQTPENCSIADKMRLMSRGISIKPSQDKNSTTKEQTRSKDNQDISK